MRFWQRLPGGRDDRDAPFEIQIHPSDIRRGVRYLFLSRRQMALGLGLLGLYLLFLGFSLWTLPGVVSSHWTQREYQQLLEDREQQGAKLRPQVADLELLADRASELRLTLDRLYLAYGLSIGEAVGRTGYPLVADPVPASISTGVFGQLVRKGSLLETRIDEQLHVVDSFTKEVQALEAAKRELTLTTPSICPLEREKFVVTSPFGNRRNPFTQSPDFHAGVDLAALEGTPVFAPADGQVVFAGLFPLRRSRAWWQYGNLVILKHSDDLVSLYGHCSEVLVKKGDKVRRGEKIATVGNTGYSTNSHLHYEVRRRNEDGKLVPVDPRIYMLNLELSEQEKLLVARRSAPSFDEFEPLPRLTGR
ncbi:MAG: M23 family metallopeptidase [Acidobacteria bacterium]|nr:M23 family metallopeptidase [Acidobacteriota bacterium]